MSREDLVKELHVEARRYVKESPLSCKYDKKKLRYNDLVSIALFFQDIGNTTDTKVAYAGLYEGLAMCTIDSYNYIPKKSLTDFITEYRYLV